MTDIPETLPSEALNASPRRWPVFLAIWVLGMVCLVAGIILLVQTAYITRIYTSANAAPSSTTAIVLGAGIRPNGIPSDALKDRLDRTIELYRNHLVQRIFVTGDDGAYHVDEISVMTNYLVRHEIPTSTMQIDGKGYRTYESCKHAAEQGVRDAIVVTQRFHIGRALYLCNRLGVDAIGVTSDLQSYRDSDLFWIRDLFSSFKAWIDINLYAPAAPA